MEAMEEDSPRKQEIWAVGNNTDNQFALTPSDKVEDFLAKPKYLDYLSSLSEQIIQVTLGEKHTLLLTKNGHVFSCGANNYGQLGRKSKSLVDVIELRSGNKITLIATGYAHNLAITEDGRLFSWGLNDNQQCGAEGNNMVVPTRVENYIGIIQIACGSLSSIVLTESNKVIIFGWFINEAVGSHEVDLFKTVPVHQIAAGGDHFAVITSSGTLLCWGRNEFGQSSTWKKDEIHRPEIITEGLRTKKVVHVVCGNRHTVALTYDNHVYSFGDNTVGQLGINHMSTSRNPPQLVKCLSGTIKSIACGSSHTMILTSETVYGCGSNDYGQLGHEKLDENTFMPMKLGIQNGNQLYLGWDQSVVLKGDCQISPTSHLKMPRQLHFNDFAQLLKTADKVDVIAQLMFFFDSPSCLNGSFLRSDLLNPCTMTTHNMNLDEVRSTFELIEDHKHAKEFTDSIITALDSIQFEKLYEELLLLTDTQVVLESLRVFLILPWFHIMVQPEVVAYRNTIVKFIDILDKMMRKFGPVFRTWWVTVEARHFNRIVSILMNYVKFLFKLNPTPSESYLSALYLLKIFCELNNHSNIVPYEKFYLNGLSEKVNVQQDYLEYYALTRHTRIIVTAPKTVFKWSEYPFLFNGEAKCHILNVNSALKKHITAADIGSMQPFMNPEEIYIQFRIRRDSIVNDSFNEIYRYGRDDLHRPLKVTFHGEDADDRGGVTKEYFMLLFQEILQPTYGMFVEDPQSHLVWFSGVDGDVSNYQMVGRLAGLAIYNHTIVHFPFPIALYRKLLNQKVTFEDFKELHPQEADSLEKILDYEGDDLEDIFCLYFTAPVTVFEHTENIPLIENGENLPVTQANKKEFVQKYIELKLEKGRDNVLHEQLFAFIQGFKETLDEDVISIFQPRELMELVIGQQNIDWQEFRETTDYKGVYHARHPTILAFWEAFFTLDDEEKKKFLIFLTGSDRVPLQGLKAIHMTIQPEPEHLFPVAHTCFNLLDLPQLTDVKEMRRRLLTSTQNATGFTLA